MIPLLAQAVVTSETVVANSTGYALGWGTLSLINAGLAQSKNRSGLLWWFLSLFLGPIATFLIVAFLDKNDVVAGKPRPLDSLS